jgi:basic membrane protein A and related proteins
MFMMPSGLLRFRKIFISAAVLTLLSLLISPSSYALTHQPISSLRIAILYDQGGRGDGAINDSAALGLDRAKKKFNLSSLAVREMVTLGSESDRESRLAFLAKAGYNLVIAVGPSQVEAVTHAANDFPDTQFAIIGSAQVPGLNVTSMDFAENQGAFLAGVLAAQTSPQCRVAFVGSTADGLSPYASGAMYINKKCQVTQVISPNIKAADVLALAKKKVDVLFSTWSTSDVVMTSCGKAKIKYIGRSPEQFFLQSGSTQVIASVAKRYDAAVYDVISALIADNLPRDILNEKLGVYGHRYSLADSGVWLHVFGSYVGKLDQIKSGIISGRIKIH